MEKKQNTNNTCSLLFVENLCLLIRYHKWTASHWLRSAAKIAIIERWYILVWSLCNALCSHDPTGLLPERLTELPSTDHLSAERKITLRLDILKVTALLAKHPRTIRHIDSSISNHFNRATISASARAATFSRQGHQLTFGKFALERAFVKLAMSWSAFMDHHQTATVLREWWRSLVLVNNIFRKVNLPNVAANTLAAVCAMQIFVLKDRLWFKLNELRKTGKFTTVVFNLYNRPLRELCLKIAPYL